MEYPTILQPGKAEELNNKVFAQTGCFFFLHVEEFPFPKPTTDSDFYLYEILALYSLYHDYGCGFLRSVVQQEALLPPVANARQTAIKNMRKNAWHHYCNICQCYRPVLCHGTYPNDSTREKILTQLQYDSGIGTIPTGGLACLKEISKSFPDFWKSLGSKLQYQSNLLYNFLSKWGEWWGECAESEREQLRNVFVSLKQDGDMDDWTCQTDPNKKGNSLFLDSFDQRVCKSFINTVEAELKKSGEDGQLWPEYKTIWYPGCAEDGGVYTWVKQIKDKLLAKKYLSYHEISSELMTAIKQSLLGRPGTEERLPGDSSGESAEEFGLGIPNIDGVSEKGVLNNSLS